MKWEIEYSREAQKDVDKLDNSAYQQVIRAVRRVAVNPLPNTEGGYGKPLGNKAATKLAGYLKIKLKKLGLRVVYGIIREGGVMKIIVVSIRDEEEVYKIAEERIGGN